MQLAQARRWLNEYGKIWFLRVMFIAGIAISALSAFGFYPLSTNTLLAFIIGVLFVFAELVFDETTEVRRLRAEGLSLDWVSAVPMIRDDVQKAHTVVIIARSGETSYYALRDILLDRGSKLTVSVTLTTTPEDGDDFITYQHGWTKRWEELFRDAAMSATLQIIKVSSELQAIIIDDSIGYLSYREQPVGTKAIALPQLRVTTDSNQGRFLVTLYKSWLKRHQQLTRVSP